MLSKLIEGLKFYPHNFFQQVSEMRETHHSIVDLKNYLFIAADVAVLFSTAAVVFCRFDSHQI